MQAASTGRVNRRRRPWIAALAALGMMLPAVAVSAQEADDPRADLGGGVHDAEEASWNMDLLASLEKPDGFFNPADPGDFSFANSDLAFSGDNAIMGNYAGALVYDIADPQQPELRTAISCPGGQGDISVVGDLMFISVQQFGTYDCSTLEEGDDEFQGVRVFDVSDFDNPEQVATVDTCRGSHTHTVVTDPDDASSVYVYVHGTNPVRTDDHHDLDCEVGPVEEDEDGNEFPSNDPDDFDADTETDRFQIEIIDVPVDSPEDAHIANEPRVFADGDGNPFGLEEGGQQGEDGQTVATTDACHDITAYPEIGLAAGACEGNGILFDITDPVNPERIQAISDESFAYWHSATFSNDGDKVVFTDELGGGVGATCVDGVRDDFGANGVYDIVETDDGPRMQFASHHKIPHVQSEEENCVAHNGSLLPVEGRDILVQAWYQGGISVMDFTDSANPEEIAFFDRGPVDEDELVLGGFWSAYYYNGHIYGSEIARGFDVLELTESEHLSQAELDEAADVRLREFNPQHQPMITDADRSACAGVALGTFPDVGDGPHLDNVGCIAGYGVALGHNDGTYRPGNDVARDQMAGFLQRVLRVAGVDLPENPEQPFGDVEGSEHELAVNQLAELDIIEGRTATTYEPREAVTRAQMASLIVGTVETILDEELASPRSPFTDNPSGGPHTSAIDAAYEAGIVEGRTATTYEPSADVRRDQMGSFIARSLELLHHELVELNALD